MRIALGLFAAVLTLSPAMAAPPKDVPEARQVVVRRAASLDAAILAAFGGRTDQAEARAALVIDVTPHTRKQAANIADALRALDGNPQVPEVWQATVLGKSFPTGGMRAAELAPKIHQLMGQNLAAQNTVSALRDTIRSLRGKGGTVIYLADWRFEDEHALEKLISQLAAKDLAFGVVGSEAAFGRGWNDGVLDPREQLANGQMVVKSAADQKLYDETIGRRPFGPFDAKAPWHGGDTAYPHVPYRFSDRLWETVFPPSRLRFGKADDKPDLAGGDLEDLLERLGRDKKVFDSASGRSAALPSAYGPYGLMRTAAVRGGRYVLWSWNPSGRASLTYDYARCDLFGPDLRGRTTIRKDASRRPLARALLRAWDAIGSKFNALAKHTAPLDKSGTRPQSIDLLERSAASLQTMWQDKGQYKEFVRKATHWRNAARAADKLLTKALKGSKDPRDAPDRRYAADAELLRHICRVLDFELSEALAVAARTPEEVWKRKDIYPGIRPVTWIEPGDDPDKIRLTKAVPRDPDHALRVRDARADHLRRFKGTPFGVQVAANRVDTWMPAQGERIEPTPGTIQPPGRTPSESDGSSPPPSPRGPGSGSGGAGPSSGG